VAGTDLKKWEPGGLTTGKIREVSGPPMNSDFVETYTVGEFMLKFIP